MEYYLATPNGHFVVSGPAGASHQQLSAAIQQHVGGLSVPGLPGTPTERNLAAVGAAVGAGAIAKIATGSWAWAIGIGLATPVAIAIGLMIGIGAKLTSSVAAALTPAPAGSTTTNQSIALKPGAMAPLSTVSGASSGPGMAPQLAFQPSSPTGRIMNYTSSNPSVIPSLDPFFATPTGVGTVALGAFSPGTTTLTFTWTDGNGAKQTSTVVVTAS